MDEKKEILMEGKLEYLTNLELGNEVLFILANGIITGKVKTKFNITLDCIEIENVEIPNDIQNRNITIKAKNILAWETRKENINS